MAFNWICPHCSFAQAVTSTNFGQNSFPFRMSKSALGFLGLSGTIIVCANAQCVQPTISVSVLSANYNITKGYRIDGVPEIFLTLQLLPDSTSKPQPSFIPQALREDYLEACKIVELSPKAASTLARRCLQGMIRVFLGLQIKAYFAK
jgi:hypothetical protein